MAITIKDWLYDENGNPVSGAAVTLQTGVATGEGGTVSSVTTDGDGAWSFSGVSAGTYDVKVAYGTTVIRYKGLSVPPQSIQDANVGASAGILLTKLDFGTADETQNPASMSVTTLDGRISQVVSQFKKATGGTHWYDAPDTTLLKAVRMANGASSTKLWVSSAALNTNSTTTVDSGSVAHGGAFSGTPTAAFYTVEGAPSACLPASVATTTLTSTNIRFVVTWKTADASSPHAFSVNYFIVGV